MVTPQLLPFTSFRKMNKTFKDRSSQSTYTFLAPKSSKKNLFFWQIFIACCTPDTAQGAGVRIMGNRGESPCSQGVYTLR